MLECKFLYYLSAIGQNNLDIKLFLLKKNLIYIYNNINVKFDIMLNCYDDVSEIQDLLNSLDFLDKIM